MGVGSSKEGDVSIQIEKKIYSPGDTITAKACLNLKTPLKNVTLVLKLHGKEAVYLAHKILAETHPKGKVPVVALKKQKQDIIDFKIPIYSWNSLPVGQYSIPFTFLLPQDLPGSFYAKGKDFAASISYSITLELESPSLQDKKLKYKEKLVVKNALNKPYQTLSKSQSSMVGNCCCNKGRVAFHASIEKNILAGGEKTELVIDVDNSKSGVVIQSVRCELVQRVNFRAEDYNVSQEIISNLGLTGSIERGKKMQKRLQVSIPHCQKGDLKEFKKLELANIVQKLCSGSSLNISLITTKSRLIETSHYIRVTCSSHDNCFTVPPMLIPIEVVYEKIKENYASAPIMWQPQMLDPVNFVVKPPSSAISYSSKLSRDMWEGSMDAYNQMMMEKKKQ